MGNNIPSFHEFKRLDEAKDYLELHLYRFIKGEGWREGTDIDVDYVPGRNLEIRNLRVREDDWEAFLNDIDSMVRKWTDLTLSGRDSKFAAWE